MKKIYMIAAAALTLGLTSCDNNSDLYGTDAAGVKNGQLQLQLVNNGKANTVTPTRAEATDNGNKLGTFPEAELNVQNYLLSIINNANGAAVANGTVQSQGGNNGKVTKNLGEGTYKVAAQNYDGSNVTVSIRPWFKGETTLSILPGKSTERALTCKLQNIQMGVTLSKEFNEKFKDDYAVTVDNGSGAVNTFTKENISQLYYFQVPEAKNSITVSVKATTAEKNEDILKTYTVTKPADAEGNTNLEAGDAFMFNLTADGSMLSYVDFGMSVDFSFAEQNEIFTIPSTNITYDESKGETGETPDTPQPGDEPVTFTGLPAEYTNPAANGQEVVVTMKAPAGIENLFVTITTDNENFAGTIEGLGLGGTFDMANAGDENVPGTIAYVLTHSLSSGEGIGLMQPGEVIKGKTSYTFNVTDFMGLLPLYGSNNCIFSMKVVDADGNEKSGDLKVTITQ